MQIISSNTSTQLWFDLVREAEEKLSYSPTEAMESYLVFTLMRFLKRNDLSSKIVALDYLGCLGQAQGQKSDSLRDVGDACLLFSGFFPKVAEKKLVRVSYFTTMGIMAYRELAKSHRMNSASELYNELVREFHHLMDILLVIHDMKNAHSSLTPLEVMEIYIDNRSEYALRVLQEKTDNTNIFIPPTNTKQ